jgi:hypothetical protein
VTRTVEELLADADALPDGTLSARLDAIERSASGDGVTVTVNLYGKLTGIRFDPAALKLGPTRLAERIQELSGEAGAGALAEGRAVLGELGDGIFPEPEVYTPVEDETLMPSSWAQ